MNSIEKDNSSSKIIIFDFDETLVHSKDMFNNVNRRAMEKMGFAHTEDIVKNLFAWVKKKYIGWGKNLEEQITIYDNEYSNLVTELSNQEEFLSQVYFYDGMIEVIKMLAKTDYKLAIASSRDLYSILAILQRNKLNTYFSTVKATEGGKNFKDKPDPQIINHISDELNAKSENVVMIGDTSSDIKMGKSAGMKTIGIGYGEYTSVEKIKEYSPDAVVESVKDIKNIPFMVANVLKSR